MMHRNVLMCMLFYADYNFSQLGKKIMMTTGERK